MAGTFSGSTALPLSNPRRAARVLCKTDVTRTTPNRRARRRPAMSDRSMRGTRLGAQSLESDSGVQPAARQDVVYHCPNGHTVVVPLSVEAEVPALWECRCGEMALRENHERPDEKPVKPARTHWDMLMERRTTAELEELLEERLELLRSGRLHQRRSA